MLKITKLEGYAFLILTYMAKQDVALMHSAKDLSANCDLPLPTVSKVLKLLAAKGILISHQGSRGGYVLAKPAEQISVAETVEVFEGPLALTDCCGETGCERNCRVGPNWQKLNHTLERWLRGMTLADMANEKPDALPLPSRS